MPEDSSPRPQATALPEAGLHRSTCPACGHHVAVACYDGGRQPLATLAWPKSADEARAMRRYPLGFVRCVDCGHVYNPAFDYAVVPYADKPNRMFNRGEVWSRHLARVRKLILERIPQSPTVVEIGCGDGGLLRSLAGQRGQGRYIGFDPGSPVEGNEGLVETHRRLFEPAEDLARFRPDLVVSRHVFEHLMNPLGFIQALSFAASWQDIGTRLFIEVPCIDKALAMGRTVDFFYEHASNFTAKSLERMLQRCATSVELVERGYQDEVVYGLARFTRQEEQIQFAREALAFQARTARLEANVQQALDDLAETGKTVAIWGGTGKAATFINQHQLDARRFPIVVDSDAEKAGTYVPGTGQEIRFRDYLLEHPVKVILIATQWRAPDIVAEIEQAGIAFETILLEYGGRLLNYYEDEHRYRAA